MKADGTVIIDTRIDTKGVDTGISTMKSQFGKLSGIVRKIGTIVGAAFAVKQLVQFGKEAIQLGSDLAEVQNVVDVTFGNLSGEVDSFAKNAVTQFGLSELSAKQFTSTMGAMLKSMGFTERAAADMGMSIAGLAGDIASFYNLGTEEAFYKIRSGISGETEPLKQLGINLSVANLEQYALTQGITKSYNAMTQQEQALLRYNYLLSVTSDAQGDFSRTSESWATGRWVYNLPIMEESEMQMVTLVYTDRHQEEHTAEGAERLCRNPEVSGRIMDALTEDGALQERLRRLMDETASEESTWKKNGFPR